MDLVIGLVIGGGGNDFMISGFTIHGIAVDLYKAGLLSELSVMTECALSDILLKRGLEEVGGLRND